MHLLNRLKAWPHHVANKCLNDPHPRVIENALRIINENQQGEQLSESLSRLISNGRPRIQLQLAMIASDLNQPAQDNLFRKLLAEADHPMVVSIVASFGNDTIWSLLSDNDQDLPFETTARWTSLALANLLTGSRPGNRVKKVQKLLERDFIDPKSDNIQIWLNAIADLPAGGRATFLSQLAPATLAALRTSAADRLEASPSSSIDARLLGVLSDAQQLNWADTLLTPRFSPRVQLAVLSLLDRSPNGELVDLILQRFQSLTPAVQRAFLRRAIGSDALITKLTLAVKQEQIVASQIPPDVRASAVLLRSEIANQFSVLFESINTNRQEIIEKYAKVVPTNEAPIQKLLDSGKVVFQKACAQCHRLDDVGNDVGPPLQQLGQKTPHQLLEAILDPNREVDPKYMSYTVLLMTGQILTGVITEEAGSVITLVEAGGKQHRVARSDIDAVKSTGMSLMPNGLETQISVSEMQSLVEYLRHIGNSSQPANR